MNDGKSDSSTLYESIGDLALIFLNCVEEEHPESSSISSVEKSKNHPKKRQLSKKQKTAKSNNLKYHYITKKGKPRAQIL